MTPQASFGYSARAWATMASRIAAGTTTDAGPGCAGAGSVMRLVRPAGDDPQEQRVEAVLRLGLDGRHVELEAGRAHEGAIALRPVMAEEHRHAQPVGLDLVGCLLRAHRGDKHAARPEPA